MSNTAEVIKHAAAIRIGNRMSLIGRRIWNVLLYRAYPDMLVREIHTLTVAQLRMDVGYHGGNMDWLKRAFRELNSIDVEWDVLSGLHQSRWGVSSALASAEIHNGRVCEWSYAPPMRRELFRPEIYARLNLDIQNRFRSSNSLALWEFFNLNLRATATAIVRLSVTDFKTLLDIDGHKYREFSELATKVIKRSIKELNVVSDMVASVAYVRENRRVQTLEFSVQRRSRPALTAVQTTQQPITARLTADFGLSMKDSLSFVTKFTDQERITELLDGIQKKYIDGKIQRDKLTAYTYATLTRASPSAPALIKQGSMALNVKRPTPSTAELIEAGRQRYEAMDDWKQRAIEQAWVKTLGIGVIFLWYKERGLDDPAVKSEFFAWVGQWAVPRGP